MFETIKEKHRRNPLFHAILLAGFALISAILLISGDLATREAIKQRQVEDLKFSLGQVIPGHIHNNDLWRDTLSVAMGDKKDARLIYLARNQNKTVAVAFELVTQGYNGNIRILVGIEKTGKILGVRVLSHTETPGLGDKINVRKSDWILSFDGKSLKNPPVDKWKVKKDGGAFDQLSGATITPRAIVKAVREGLVFFNNNRDDLLRMKRKEGQ